MIFFFYGPNSYAARQQMARMRAEYVRKTGSDIGIERIDATKASLGPLTAALQASPFLAASRLVIVEDLGKNKPLASKVGDLLAQIPSTTVAIFYDEAPDQRTSYFKTLSDVENVVKFEQLTAGKLARWVGDQVKQAGGDIDPPVINRLLEIVGDDQWRLSGEITKLVAYATVVTIEAVDKMVESSEQQTIFNLIDHMIAGNSSQALNSYQVLRTSGMHEMQILNMVNWQLRNTMVAKAAGDISAADLARQAGMSPYVAGKILAKSGRHDQEILNQAFLQSVDTEYKIKSGQGSSDVLVEQLIYDVSVAVKR